MEKYVTKRQLVVIILFLIIFVVGLNMKESYSEKEVKRVQPIVNKINSLEPEMEKLSDDTLNPFER